jgi:hypothetical protein
VRIKQEGARWRPPVRWPRPLRCRGWRTAPSWAGAVVGPDVDKADRALLDLALQGRADALGLFDIFGVAAERLGHLVVAGVAEVGEGPAGVFNGRSYSAVCWLSAELIPLFFEKIPLLFRVGELLRKYL